MSDLYQLKIEDFDLNQIQTIALEKPCLNEAQFLEMKKNNSFTLPFGKHKTIYLYMTVSPADKYKTFMWQMGGRIANNNKSNFKRIGLWMKKDFELAQKIMSQQIENVGQSSIVFFKDVVTLSLTKEISDLEFNYILKKDNVFNWVVKHNFVKK